MLGGGRLRTRMTEPTAIHARFLSLWAVSYIKVAQRETSTKKKGKRETRKELFDHWRTKINK